MILTTRGGGRCNVKRFGNKGRRKGSKWNNEKQRKVVIQKMEYFLLWKRTGEEKDL